MGEKDISEKTLMDYNDVFADIYNVLVFNGEKRINEEELQNRKVRSQYKADDGKLHEDERDALKYWKKGEIELAIYGIENQTRPDSLMPFRAISYDGASYHSQLLEKKKKIVPVMTIVLYFGTDNRWNEKSSIKELLDIPEGLEKYVNDYKIHVFEIAWLSDEQLKMFKSDFGIVANFFVQKRRNKDYIPDDKRVIQHVDEVLKLLSVMTKDNKYEQLLYDGKDRVNKMCEVMDRVLNKGKTEERIRIIRSKLEKGMTIEEIADLIEISVEEAVALTEQSEN